MKRIISAFLGIILIGVVIFLGVKSGSDTRFIVPFGIVSALIAPIGISAVGYSIRKEDPTLKKLALVPEIDSLIEKAETESEKIERLKIEKEKLLYYIECQAKVIAKLERKKILEEDAGRILDEYEKIMSELVETQKGMPNMDAMSDEIKELYEMQKLRENIHENNVLFKSLSSILEASFNAYSLPAEIIIDLLSDYFITLIKIVRKIIRKLWK